MLLALLIFYETLIKINTTQDFYDPSDVKIVPSTIKLATYAEGERPTLNTSSQVRDTQPTLKEIVCQTKYKWNCQDALRVIFAESSNNPRAVQTNKDGSKDRGLWQFNSKWHPEVSDSCAFDLECSTGHAYRLWTVSSFRPWYGAHKIGL